MERVSGNDRLNLIAGWHGTTEESCWNIAEKNFYDPAEREARRNPNKPIDPGYFGKGIYFTQYPVAVSLNF